MPILDSLKKILFFQEPTQAPPFELLEPPWEGYPSAEAYFQEKGGTEQAEPGRKRSRKKRAPLKPWKKTDRGDQKDTSDRQSDNRDDQGAGGSTDGTESTTPEGDGKGGQDQGDQAPLRPGVENKGQQGQKRDDAQTGGAPGQNEGSQGRWQIPKKVPQPSEVEISQRLEDNIEYIKELFGWPVDNSIILREFTLGLEQGVKAVAVYQEGLTDAILQAEAIFKPLMIHAREVPLEASGTLLTAINKQLTPANSVIIIDGMTDAVENICSGSTVLFFQGVAHAVSVETAGWKHRGVEQPTSERVVRGSQEAFNEDLMSNVALVRRLIRDPKLYREIFVLGRRSRTEAAVLYISDIANPALVSEVKRRISSLDIDSVRSLGQLSQLIEDEPRVVYPVTLQTERVDRACAALLEGKVVVLVEGDPFVGIYPASVWGHLQTSEDYNLKEAIGGMLRTIRWISALMVILLPGFYVAVVSYHHEMVPTDLLLSIAFNREHVPLPSVIEVVLMEISFELIREGGTRIPGVIGTTLGIVGALILGQAAVAASIVSPIVIIIVALTGMASFSIPSYGLSNALRAYRFLYILAAALLGLYGMGIALAMHVMLIANLKSLGVPYLAPHSPVARGNVDTLFRGNLWEMEQRPDINQPLDRYSQPPIARKWILGPRQGGGKRK